MADIPASLVKELRQKTGAGMMDCKKALGESGGDVEAAVDWLRKKGLAAAARKAGRVAAEGLVAAAVDGGVGVLVEVNSETDFVARNQTFQDFATALAQLALTGDGSLETLLGTTFPASGRTVQDEVTHLVSIIGENINVRRVARLATDAGVVSAYIHSAAAPGLGKIGVLVALDSSGDVEKVAALGRQIAMHVAAARPESVSVNELDQTLVERERAVLSDQARASGKPEEIIGKMVEGRLRKFYEEVVLLEQVYMIDGESRVKAVVEGAAADVGGPVTVNGFVRFTLGEGIEKQQGDLAAEVAATLSA